MSSRFRCATRIMINCIAAAMSAPSGRITEFEIRSSMLLGCGRRRAVNARAPFRGNGTLDPDLEAEFSEPYLRKGPAVITR